MSTAQVPTQHLAAYRKQEPCVYPVYGVLSSLHFKPVVIQAYSVQHVIDILAANRNVSGLEFHDVQEGALHYTLWVNDAPSTLRVYENPDVLY